MKKINLKITNLSYSYPGSSDLVLKPFSQEAHPGEVIGIIGKNGVGKSTLIRLLSGILQPLTGNIKIDENDSQNVDKRRDYLVNIQYLSNDRVLPGNMTIEEYFHSYKLLYPNYSNQIEFDLINKFEFKMDTLISELSTGNKMKVFFIFAIASQSPFVFIDEVTAVLDPENREDFFELINTYKCRGQSFLVATNIVDDLEGIADKVWFIQRGQLTQIESANLKEQFKKKVA